MKRTAELIKKINTANTGLRIFSLFSLVLLAVTLIIGLLTYFISYSSLMERMGRERQNILAQSRDSCEKSLKKIEEEVVQKASDPLMVQFLSDPYGQDYATMDLAIQELIAFKYSSNLIQSVYVYVPDESLIITSNDGIWADSDFYDMGWKQELGTGDGNLWLETRTISSNIEEDFSVITLISPAAGSAHSGQKGFFIVNVYESGIEKMLKIANPSETEAVSVIGRDGTLLVGSRDSVLKSIPTGGMRANDWLSKGIGNNLSVDFPSGTYLISTLQSDYNGWIYTYTISKDQALKPIASMKIFSSFSIAGCFVLGVLFLLLLFSKLWAPVSKTIDFVKSYNQKYIGSPEESPATNEMELLRQTFQNVIENNIALRNTLEKKHAALKEGFIFNLISSNPEAKLDWEQQLENYNIQFSFRNFYVFVVSIDRYRLLCKNTPQEKRKHNMALVKELCSGLVNQHGFGMVEQISRNNCLVIFNTDLDGDRVLPIADQIRRQVENLLGITVTLGISACKEKVEDVIVAYNEALEKLELRTILGGNRLITQNSSEISGDTGRLLSEIWGDRMKKNLEGGNISEIEQYLDRIIEEERKTFRYDTDEILQVYSFILVQTIKIIYENGWSMRDILDDDTNLFRELAEYENIEDMKNWLISRLRRLRDFITEKKEAKNQVIMAQILAYIDQNYSGDISLNTIADNVYLSASYVSRLFKKSLGKNYIDYLTEVRVNRAKEQLKNTNKKVSEIAQQVNLGNTQNFIRIFKKYEGTTPGQYRTKLIEEKLESEGKKFGVEK